MGSYFFTRYFRCRQVRSNFGSSLVVYAWDDAIVGLVAVRHVATEKSVMGNQWDLPIVSAKWLARLCVTNIVRRLN